MVDNGSTPFIVRLTSLASAGSAQVWAAPSTWPDDVEGLSRRDPRVVALYTLWRTVPYQRAWIGLDPAERKPRGGLLAKLLRTRPPWWHGGNSVPQDEVADFVSVMGNNAVPYPYAVGARRTYLLTENTWIENDQRDDEDPYDQFYKRDLTTGEKHKNLRLAQRRQEAHQAAHPLSGYRVLHARVL